MTAPDAWHAYECFECLRPERVGGSGVVFDVRAPVTLGTVRCPVCNTPCALRSRWEADEEGYGSRATDGYSYIVGLLYRIEKLERLYGRLRSRTVIRGFFTRQLVRAYARSWQSIRTEKDGERRA